MLHTLKAGDPPQVGPFVLLGRLGAGGMGRVFLGRSPGGRLVAIKVVSGELADDDRFRQRFAQEITAMRRVGGFWTAAVVDADPLAPVPWLATEYVPGPSLAQAVHAYGPLPEHSALMLARGLAEALAAVHTAGLVHRDLKPSNVLLTADGPRVIDFGIARAVEETALTGTGQVVGTPGFASPEQAKSEPVGPPSDIFCLGLVVVYAVTGANPFGTGGSLELLYRVVHEDPDLTDVPAPLYPLVWHCLARRPEARPTPAQLLAGLRRPTADEAAGWLPPPVTRLIRDHAEGVQTQSARAVPVPVHEAVTATDPSGGAAPPDARTPVDGPPSGLTRRRLLTGIAGTTVVAAAGIAGWQLLADGDSPDGDGRKRGASAGAAAVRPGRARWTSVLGEDIVSLAVADGAVYAGGSIDDGEKGSVFALRAAGGKRRWKVPAAGSVGPLAVAGDVLYLAPYLAGSGAYALNTSDGRQRWKADGGRPGWSVQTLAVAGDTVYLGNIDVFGGSSDAVIALDAAGGKQRWSFPTDGAAVGETVVAGDTVYAAVERGGAVALAAADGELVWRFAPSGWLLWTVAVADGTVYSGATPADGVATEGMMFAVDAAGGEKRWEIPVEQGGSVFAVAGDTVYTDTAASADKGAVIAVDTASGNQRWSFPTGKPVNALAESRGTLYAGSGPSEGAGSGAVFAVDAANGSRRWKLPTARGVRDLAVTDGTLYAATGDKVIAIRT
ncbi:protein kinase domain-containing protein [Streptomyces sp. CRN 30]|uniref:protein kinase domain-containing protein n=1 Tax=Streptomyces sp. CRN 30 TaxID=3075613 RepID=UPI002A836F83|nr:PQQ-binding-like beta-propeller repeat protein [Streptomyces sp. CRN 30]